MVMEKSWKMGILGQRVVGRCISLVVSQYPRLGAVPWGPGLDFWL